MVNIALVKTDSVLEAAGVWVEWIEGVRLRIARAGNPKFDAMMQRLSEPFMQGMRAETMPDGKADEILKGCVAETILLDWGGLEGDDGEPLPYSAQMALEFFNDPELRDLYKFVLVTSNEQSRYRRKLDADAAKN